MDVTVNIKLQMQRRKIAIKLDKIYLKNSSFGEADIFSPF